MAQLQLEVMLGKDEMCTSFEFARQYMCTIKNDSVKILAGNVEMWCDITSILKGH